MQHLDAFFAEQPLEVEVLDVERAAHFAGPIVVHARPPRAEAAVGDVELMA